MQNMFLGVLFPEFLDVCSHLVASTRFLRCTLQALGTRANSWVAVKELNLSYYIGETLLFTIYTHYGNLIP